MNSLNFCRWRFRNGTDCCGLLHETKTSYGLGTKTWTSRVRKKNRRREDEKKNGKSKRRKNLLKNKKFLKLIDPYGSFEYLGS